MLKGGIERPVTSMADFRKRKADAAAAAREPQAGPSYEWCSAQGVEDGRPAVFIGIYGCEHYIPNPTAIDMAVGMLAMAARAACAECEELWKQPGGGYCTRHQVGWLAELLIERLRGVPECEAIVERLREAVADEALIAALRL